MSTLQLGLIVAGILLVAGVVIYNAWQERRLRARLGTAAPVARPDDAERAGRRRTEPTLGGERDDMSSAAAPGGASAVRPPSELPASPFAVPMGDISTLAAGASARSDVDGGPDEYDADPPGEGGEDGAMGQPDSVAMPPFSRQERTAALDDEAGDPLSGAGPVTGAWNPGELPDPDIECIVVLALSQPVTAALLSQGLHARLGKPLRWFGRSAPGAPWQLVNDAATGRFTELCACLLLADRNGALSEAQLNAFFRVVSEQGAALGARVTLPDVAAEQRRAEALDKLCADLDVQIGLTVMKQEPGSVAGTRLRGVAEAAGFQLAAGGRFEHVQEDTGIVLYTLTNVRNEPFTVESLRVTATNGVVFLLDVPRVTDPPRTFDQMKMAAKRMAKTLGAELVDDNRRPLDDAALAKIRAQVQAAADGLAELHIEPGSPRAMALFGA